MDKRAYLEGYMDKEAAAKAASLLKLLSANRGPKRISSRLVGESLGAKFEKLLTKLGL